MRRYNLPSLFSCMGFCLLLLMYSLYSYKGRIPCKMQDASSSDVQGPPHSDREHWSISLPAAGEGARGHTENVANFCITAARKGVMNELSLLLKSMFLHSSRSDLFLHFLADLETQDEIHRFMAGFDGLKRRVQYETKLLDLGFIVSESDKLKVLINHHRSHPSGVYGMSKLFFYKIWENLERCIILDTDLLFSKDPALLWAEFNKIDNHSAIMMSVNRVARACNSGVMLQNYHFMRQIKFEQLYANGVPTYCNKSSNVPDMYQCGTLADQNLYHQVFMQFPSLFTHIDRSWNLELCRKFDGYDFASGHSARNPELFYGMAHFNCLRGDNAFNSFVKQNGTRYPELAAFIQNIQRLGNDNFTEGRWSVQRCFGSSC